jgi:hypothetical protein
MTDGGIMAEDYCNRMLVIGSVRSLPIGSNGGADIRAVIS